EAGVPAGAAGGEDEAIDLAEVGGAEVEAAEVGGGAVGGEAAAHGVFEGGGLLEDFLEHVVRVVAELGVVNVPGDGVDDRRDVGEVERGDAEAGGGQVHEFAVLEVNDVLSAADHGGDVGGD